MQHRSEGDPVWYTVTGEGGSHRDDECAVGMGHCQGRRRWLEADACQIGDRKLLEVPGSRGAGAQFRGDLEEIGRKRTASAGMDRHCHASLETIYAIARESSLMRAPLIQGKAHAYTMKTDSRLSTVDRESPENPL